MNITGGSTDVTTYFVLRLAATGVEATGLTITNFDLQYVRTGVAPTAKVDATALAATDSAHSDNTAIEIDATDQPGLYRVDWPDAAFAAGVKQVILTVKCATCFTEHLAVNIDTPVNVTGMAAGVVTAAAIANGAIDAATFAADVDAEILSYIVDDATRIDASSLNTAAVTSIPAILVDTGTDIPATLTTIASYIDTEIATLQTSVDDLPTNAELATALAAADDAVLAQVALVKAKTDSLTFTVAGQVDSNVTYVNEIAVTGDGQSGTEWGPA